MAQRYNGTCAECGKETEVTLIDEVTSLCDDCIEELDYIECDECHEFWRWDAVSFRHLKDGRTLCEDCAQKLMDEGELSEEDVDTVDGQEDKGLEEEGTWICCPCCGKRFNVELNPEFCEHLVYAYDSVNHELLDYDADWMEACRAAFHRSPDDYPELAEYIEDNCDDEEDEELIERLIDDFLDEGYCSADTFASAFSSHTSIESTYDSYIGGGQEYVFSADKPEADSASCEEEEEEEEEYEEEEYEEDEDEEICLDDYYGYPFAMEVVNYTILNFSAECKEQAIAKLLKRTGLSLKELEAHLGAPDEDEDDRTERLDIVDDYPYEFWEEIFDFDSEEGGFRFTDTCDEMYYGDYASKFLESMGFYLDENINYGAHGHGTEGVYYLEALDRPQDE